MRIDFGNFRIPAVTLVANEFIDRYMPSANGEYVKVYLYLLRHAGEEVGQAEIADALELTEGDVRRALIRWQRDGLLTAEETGTVTKKAEPVKVPAQEEKTQLSAEGTTNLQPTCNRLATDTISRQEAKPRYIDANEIPYCEVLDADTHKGTGRFMADKKDIDALPSAQPYTDEEIQKMQDLEQAQLDKAYELGRQSAQPERLTDDDFETIRIHLNAYKEKLCNQQRWKEADEYQRIIDRFMAFASVQPDPNVLEQEYLKGWEDGRKNLLEYISRLLSLPSAQPDWNELTVICDNCGHAIHVKRITNER